jgi:hypothetical protein
MGFGIDLDLDLDLDLNLEKCCGSGIRTRIFSF